MLANVTLMTHVNRGDLDAATKLMTKMEGNIISSAFVIESLIQLATTMDESVLAKKPFLQFLAKNADKMSVGKLVSNLLRANNWSYNQMDQILKALSVAEDNRVHNKYLSACFSSYRAPIYAPRALVTFLTSDVTDKTMAEKVIRNAFNRTDAPSMVSIMIQCARLQPARLNTSEAVRDSAVALIAKEMTKKCSVDEMNSIVNEISKRFVVESEVMEIVKKSMSKSE